MFRRAATKLPSLEALERVELAARRRFGLAPADLVFVSEEPLRRPGYPPQETLVLFWSGDTRHRFRIFRPVAEVRPEDIPPAWLLPSLIDDGEADCC